MHEQMTSFVYLFLKITRLILLKFYSIHITDLCKKIYTYIITPLRTAHFRQALLLALTHIISFKHQTKV